MFKKKPLPATVDIYIHGDGVIDFNDETGAYDATVTFSPWFEQELDGERKAFNLTWTLLRWGHFEFTPIGYKYERRFNLDRDECDVLLTFSEPWKFTMNTDSMDAAQDQLLIQFQARYDRHMAALTNEGVHREVTFKMLGAGKLTLTPGRSEVW